MIAREAASLRQRCDVKADVAAVALEYLSELALKGVGSVNCVAQRRFLEDDHGRTCVVAAGLFTGCDHLRKIESYPVTLFEAE